MCLGVVLAGCSMSSPAPIKYSNLSTSPYLQASPDDDAGRMPFSYSVRTDWSIYHSATLDPVVIYRGSDNQFGDLTEKEKAELASYMREQFAEKLAKQFQSNETQHNQALRIRLTLTGAAKTMTFLGPVTRFDLSGGLYNGFQSARGHEGLFYRLGHLCRRDLRCLDQSTAQIFYQKAVSERI